MTPDIDGFAVEAEIGRGGFGVVYRARQLAFNRLVAIKVLHSSGAPATRLERQFAKECLAVGALRSHVHILRVYSTGLTRDGAPYLAMELLSGGPLSRRIPMSPEAVRELGIKLAGALQVAHEGGVVHRDVKPGNVLFNGDDEPVLVDFGISAIVGEASTTTSSVAISIGYTPPEVLDGAGPAVPADVYALGATLFAAATGRTPFVPSGGLSSVGVVAARILNTPVEDLRSEGVPDWLCRVIETAMAKSPADRYPSMAAMQRALREAGSDDTVRVAASPWRETKPLPPGDSEATPTGRTTRLAVRRRRRAALAVLAAIVVAAAAAVGGYLLTRGSPAHKTTAAPPVKKKTAGVRDRTDLNCDGFDDLIAVGTTGKIANQLLIYPRAVESKNGLPTYWKLVDPSFETADPHFGTTSFRALILPGDLNGDGYPDLVGEDDDGALWLMPGNCTDKDTFSYAARQRISNPTYSHPQFAAVGDLNGDGHPDLLAVDSENDLFFYAGTGSPSGALRSPVPVGQDWTSAIGVGDVNGDGIPDVIDRTSDGTLELYEGNGRGGLSTQPTKLALRLPPSEFPYVLGGVDVTLGHRPDLLAIDRNRKLVSFAAEAAPRFFASTCGHVGNGWGPPGLVDVADATPVPGVPPVFVKPRNGAGPPDCATKTF